MDTWFGALAVVFAVIGVILGVKEIIRPLSVRTNAIHEVYVYFDADSAENGRHAAVIIADENESERIIEALGSAYDKVYIFRGENEWKKTKSASKEP